MNLTPDKYAEYFYNITPEIIKSMGGKAVFVDLDGTLVSKDVVRPTKKVLDWIESFNANNIEFILLSNNADKRVTDFSKDIGVAFYHSARKPLLLGFKKAYNSLKTKVKPEEIVMIGDQIFTDTLVARRFGAKSIYVKPIDQTSTYVKFRTRFTEKRHVNRIKEKI